jgi:hypothetical protein
MVMVNVRTLSQEFCTRIFAYFTLTKDNKLCQKFNLCSFWAHADCRGYNYAVSYVRDYSC